MRPRPSARAAWLWLVAAASLAPAAAGSAAQSLRVNAADDGLHIKVSRLPFIEGDALNRLRDGQSVGVEIELSVLIDPDRRTLWQGRQRFSLSFDIWEERFAVTRGGTPPRSVSHLTARDAEAWCLDSLVIPRAALASLGRDAPFWLRLTYRVDRPDAAAEPDDDTRFTLARLIDILGRRGDDSPSVRTMAAGPFKVPD